MSFALSRHAGLRMSQRAISAEALELLLLYGASTGAGSGAFRVWFDREARADVRQAIAEGTASRNAERWFGIAAIVSPEGVVITVMHI